MALASSDGFNGVGLRVQNRIGQPARTEPESPGIGSVTPLRGCCAAREGMADSPASRKRSAGVLCVVRQRVMPQAGRERQP